MSVSAFGVEHGDDIISKARKVTLGQRVAQGIADVAARVPGATQQALRTNPKVTAGQAPRAIMHGMGETGRHGHLYQGARKIRAIQRKNKDMGTGVNRKGVAAALRATPRPQKGEKIRDWIDRGGIGALGRHLKTEGGGLAQGSGAAGFARAAKEMELGDVVRSLTTENTVSKPANLIRGATRTTTQNNPILGPRSETVREGGRFLKPKHTYTINGQSGVIGDKKGGLTGAGKAVAASPLAAGGLGVAEYSRRKRDSIPPGM